MRNFLIIFLSLGLLPLTVLASSKQYNQSHEVIKVEREIPAGETCESMLVETATFQFFGLFYVGSQIQPVDSITRLQGIITITNPENGKSVHSTIASTEMINDINSIDETGTGSLFFKAQIVGLNPEVGAGRELNTVETILENGQIVDVIEEGTSVGHMDPMDCQELCDLLDAGQCTQL